MSTQTNPEQASIEVRTIRKLQIRLLPYLFALYVIAFVDRINIGFAALTMNRELAITASNLVSLLEFSSSATSYWRFQAISCCTS